MITTHNSLGHWRLSWDWMNDEFIFAMKRSPSIVDATERVVPRNEKEQESLSGSN